MNRCKVCLKIIKPGISNWEWEIEFLEKKGICSE